MLGSGPIKIACAGSARGDLGLAEGGAPWPICFGSPRPSYAGSSGISGSRTACQGWMTPGVVASSMSSAMACAGAMHRRPMARTGPCTTASCAGAGRGVDRIFAARAARGGRPEPIMIDATHRKAHRTAASLRQKGLFPVASAAPRAGWRSCTRSCDQHGRRLVLLLSEGQMGDHQGARWLFHALPPADAPDRRSRL